MNDGVPYQNEVGSLNREAQKEYWMIPWYAGEAPDEVDGLPARSFGEMNIALVDGRKVKNVTILSDNAYGEGWGTNLDDSKLYIYCTLFNGDSKKTKVLYIRKAGWWLTENKGTVHDNSSPSRKKLWDLLEKGITSIQ